jgi:hypothetical protein
MVKLKGVAPDKSSVAWGAERVAWRYGSGLDPDMAVVSI